MLQCQESKMKKLSLLLTLAIFLVFLNPTNHQIACTSTSSSPTQLSFEDFLKQLEAKAPDQESPTQESPAQESPTQKSQAQETQYQSSMKKSKQLEQNIIELYNKKITPLANDLSKIVAGPKFKKALEEKKKQHEQEQKAAERRLEKMKRQHPGYSPSYHPSSRGYGKDWSSPRSKGYGTDYGSDYGGYTPSYWDKGKGESALENKDNKGLGSETGKEVEKDKGKGHKKSTEDKDTKKTLTAINSLTNTIKSILKRELAHPNVEALANNGTFAELKKWFDKREDERINIPTNIASEQKETPKNKQTFKTHDKSNLKAQNKDAEEVRLWNEFANKLMIPAIKLGLSSADAGRQLLSTLQLHGYIPDSSEIQNLTKDIKEQKDKGEAAKSDLMLDRIKMYKELISNLISEIKPKDSKKITENLVKIEEILDLFNKRHELVTVADDKKIIESEEEQKLWKNFLPTLIQIITYTEAEEDPNNDLIKTRLEQQTNCAELLSKLKAGKYISDKELKEYQDKFEKELAVKIKAAKINAAKPEATPADAANLARLKTQASKIPGDPTTPELIEALK